MNDSKPSEAGRLEQILGLALLFLLLAGCFLVMRPFLSALMWAAVLGFSLWPFHRRLVKALKGRSTLAAAITTFLVTMVLVVPFVVLGFSLADDARSLAAATRNWVQHDSAKPPAWLEKIPVVGDKAAELWSDAAQEIARISRQLKASADAKGGYGTNNVAETNAVTEMPPATAETSPAGPVDPGRENEMPKIFEVLGKVAGRVQSWFLKAGLVIGRGVTEVGLSVFLLFFILKDGLTAAEWLTRGIGRIAGERGKHLVEVAGGTVRGVVYGILGTALVQGVMAGIGFSIAGVPGAALLGMLTFFLSVVPMGPPLIWIPAVIWLFSQGHTGWGIFMLVWGLGVSSVDNFVKPWLISQGSDMPFVLIFFGVIGGAFAFGFIGVFLGPTLLSVAYRLIGEWNAMRKSDAVAESSG